MYHKKKILKRHQSQRSQTGNDKTESQIVFFCIKLIVYNEIMYLSYVIGMNLILNIISNLILNLKFPDIFYKHENIVVQTKERFG